MLNSRQQQLDKRRDISNIKKVSFYILEINVEVWVKKGKFSFLSGRIAPKDRDCNEIRGRAAKTRFEEEKGKVLIKNKVSRIKFGKEIIENELKEGNK